MPAPNRNNDKRLPSTPQRNRKLVPEGERCCPICKERMETVQHETETIDVCQEHGVWLDRLELERLFLLRVRKRAGAMRRQANDARWEGRTEGFFWGILIG
jgi:Zn-finger nucleic acid-binding protein